MTTTSPGAHEFPTKYLVVALTAVMIVAAAFAIAQWAGTESRPSVAPPSEATFEASTEIAEPSAGPSGLSEALADGKLDAGLIPTPSPSIAGSGFVPETVVVSGQGGLYDALIDGKFNMDFASPNPGVQYVRGPETANRVGGLWAALAGGKLDAGSTTGEPTAQPSPAAPRAPTLSGGHQQ